jgi:transaldolase
METAAVNKLKKLYQFGQSPWYDNIDRRLIQNGELSSLFSSGIMGVTSNPTIFEKAIQSSAVYDEKIKKLKDSGLSLEVIYDEVTADDVRDVADMLALVYQRTKGVDGYVSIEVLPTYAHDALRTIEYARHIFKKIGRPNVMVKVPGTAASVEAVRTLIREGINVNVTLLFSVGHYERVACAYLEGLKERMTIGSDIHSVASVASVFISRIDTKVDHLLDVFANRTDIFDEKQKMAALKGKAAIANARLIYKRFREIFSERNFSEYKVKGGHFQRPLWASTSTKNPVYSDVVYVENLIGPYTVNTMPPSTVSAFIDHGHVALSIEKDIAQAVEDLKAVEVVGINLDTFCEEAQREGLAAFQLSFESMMNALKEKVG